MRLRPYTAVPAYVAPGPPYVAPGVVLHDYYAPRAVAVSPPLYDYAPAYAAPVTVEQDDWD